MHTLWPATSFTDVRSTPIKARPLADDFFKWSLFAKPSGTTRIAAISLSRRKSVGLANGVDTARAGTAVG